MAEWLHPINGRRNHLFTRDAKFPKYFNSACGQFVFEELLDPPAASDKQCARCLAIEKNRKDS